MSCINQILEFYHNNGRYRDLNSNSVKIWFNDMLRKLTSEKFTDEKYSLRIRNCLILLINLFTGVSEIDHYNIKGKGSIELSIKEKNKMNRIIKATILS